MKKGKKPYKAVLYGSHVYFLKRMDKKRFKTDGEAIAQCIKDVQNGSVYALEQIYLCGADALVQAYLEGMK